MASTQKTESLEYWRDFFASANNSSVFDILEQAITVAASDQPEEFSRQRTRILDSIQALDLGSREEKAKPRGLVVKIKLPSSAANPKPCLEQVAKPANKPMKMTSCLDDAALEAKLEATKRKLQDRYQEIGNNKRQKSIQILDYLPKQDFKVPSASAKKQGKSSVQSSSARKRVTKKLGFSTLQSSRLVPATY